MATRLETARPEHFPALYESLLRPLDGRISPATWRRLLENPWASDGDPAGQLLLDGDRMVGFTGYVHARLPMPEGPDEPLLNVTTWVVDPAYSSQALSLIMPALRRHDVTITNMTPLRSVHEMFSRLGFIELENSTCILRPAPLTRSAWGKTEVEFDPDVIAPLLPEWERRIAEAHRAFGRHILVKERGGEHCYAIYTPGRRRRIRSARLHWVTPGALTRGSIALRRALFRRSGALLVEVDGRLAPSELPGSHHVPLPVPRLFRSTRMQAGDVPNAFSELVLLEL